MYHETSLNNSMDLHPYYDSEYIFRLLESRKILRGDQIRRLRKKLALSGKKGRDLVQWLVSMQLPLASRPGATVEEADILRVIAADQGWKFRRLDPLDLDMEVVTRTLPSSFCRKRLVLPVSLVDGILEIACYDPLDRELQQDLERACKTRTRTVVAARGDIEGIIREFFDFKRSIAAAQSMLQAPEVDISNLEQYVKLTPADATASDKYVQKAVDHLFQYALDQRASDIHIEPKRNESLVRLRIDGVLHTVYRLPRVVHDAMCSRIKALSRLNIAERRRPQDGRMKLAWKGTDAEVRVSTVPVAFGEKIVLRLQSAAILLSDLKMLGFSSRDLAAYEGFLQHSHGMILITGPTGSGKSTTLYSTLRHMNSPDVNIVTVEDPIEMVCEDFNQISVQPQADITFASILRNILRQDPDIIMVGEIRDMETANYAIQAALTGHLVFSTLHTNDAPSAVIRLRDLGVEPYLITSTLLGVIAQRLVRVVCKWCKQDLRIPAHEIKAMGLDAGPGPLPSWKGAGCARCRNTGYWGRTGIYEVFAISEAIRRMIHSGADQDVLKAQAVKEGMRPLKLDAFEKVRGGITTWEEAVRITSI